MPLQTSRLRRTAAVAALPARAVGRSISATARSALTGVPRDVLHNEARAATAEDTRRVLGELKGGAMKVGQLLSTVDALLPQDPDGSWQEAVTALQQDNPALPFAEVEPVLAGNLGDAWRQRFADFDTEPVAAASIGQVHRATWTDGRPVAVKIQYPGAAGALLADIRSLSVALRTLALVAPGVAMPPLVVELRTRLGEELDYRREGDHQRRFAAAYRDDPEISVPDVLLAAPQVLVSEWLGGRTLAQVAATATSSDRDRAGLLYQRFFLTSPARVGLLHTDPHPGNFRLLPDGRLGVLDFGSVLVTPDGLPDSFGGLIGGMLAGDPAAVEDRLRRDGFIKPGKRIDITKLIDYLAPFTEPARHEVFHYNRPWLREQFSRSNDPRNPDFAVAMRLNMPAEQLFTHRVWLGLTGVLSGLGATVPVRPELIAHLPGFASAIGAE